jgi:hypothetical protein
MFNGAGRESNLCRPLPFDQPVESNRKHHSIHETHLDLALSAQSLGIDFLGSTLHV